MKLYLNNYFRDTRVAKYLDENLLTTVTHAADRYSRELSVSDPLPGITIYQTVSEYINQFINENISYIKVYVIGDEGADPNPIYVVSDNLPTSRASCREHLKKSPNEVLADWNRNASSALTTRDDSQAVRGNCRDDYLASTGDALKSGIVFSDQRELGVNQYYDGLFNAAFKALNRGPISGGVFGDWSREADEKLLNRRIFRNEAGVENGIPFYNKKVCVRNYERDISENLRAGEYDYKQYGLDMGNLYARVDQRQKAKYSNKSQYCL
jgi:hypothetical protein